MNRFEALATTLDSLGPTNSGALDGAPWSWYTDDWRVVVSVRPNNRVPVTLTESPLTSLHSPTTREWVRTKERPYIREAVLDKEVSTSQVCRLIDSIIQHHLGEEVSHAP